MSREHITRCDVDGCTEAKGDDCWWAIVCFGRAIIVTPHRFENDFGATRLPFEEFGSRKASFDACGYDHMQQVVAREAAALREEAE